MASVAGVLAPDGKAPVHLRALLKLNEGRVGQAAERLVALAPERVIMCHGHPHEAGATATLRTALAGFLGGGGGRPTIAWPATLGVAGAGPLIGAGPIVAKRRGQRRRR